MTSTTRLATCEIKNRGVEDVLIAVCDGLKELPEAITTSWEKMAKAFAVTFEGRTNPSDN